ncbi:MAG TPA: NAD-glutamate dehydrogenase [Acidobacteriota bacterium]|nr:NAD-glutamate dehydrogenase [Acidobacteriota bacterium]
MDSTADVLKTNLLQDLCRKVEERVTDNPHRVALFVRRFYGPVAPDDLRAMGEDNLLGAALALWNQMQVRQAGRPKIRAYNPTLEEDGWKSRHTVIEVINDDMPFLVDSVTNEISRRNLNIHVVIHPVFGVERDSEGQLQEVHEEAGEGVAGESLMHIEVDQVLEGEDLDALVSDLERVLTDVRAAVEDWHEMRRKLREIVEGLDPDKLPVPKEEVEEVREFLLWVDDNFFTYLGYREYRLERRKGDYYVVPDEETGLGILSTMLPEAEERARTPLSPTVVEYAKRKNLLLVTKAYSKSTVHRRVHMDYIGIKRFDDNGEVVGERRFLGLFTSYAYNQSVRRIPLLREKARRTVERAGLSPTGHDGKALVHILETFPRDELFQISEDQLYETAMGILQLQERQRLALFVRKDDFEKFVSCQVYVPRERYDTTLRKKIQEVLEGAFSGEIDATHSHLDDSALARWHFVIRTKAGDIPDYDAKQIESHLTEISRTWGDRLREILVRNQGETTGLRLLKRYENAFSTSYRETFGPDAALRDIECIEEVVEDTGLELNLYRPVELPENEVKFKIIHRGDIPLSRILPILENMGVNVNTEIPYEVRLPDEESPVWIRDFGLESGDGSPIDLRAVRDHFQETFACVWRGDAESDLLNRLVIRAGLTVREVTILRAYTKFLLQAGVTFSQEYMSDILFHNPELTRLLVQYFEANFDPSPEGERKARVEELRKQISTSLKGVASLDEDRIFTRYRNLINCTLRTNYFQTESECAKPYFSFKLNSAEVLDLPDPRPRYEIFVYSPRFEGVHLRGGKVARGGLRWSDRREDFRSEILGLLKAQMVKNAVIVPVGAKGGFILKRSVAREERQEEGKACYRLFIRGLLDLTDNRKGNDIVPPPDVVRYDDDDPYLVVAADKGTATFSDLANEISAEYGFWMGDAFASGGSAGYDHKKMGITAKGAFVSVARHFRELGHNIQEEDFSVVGVGDMSGDVFGNGMLLSRHIKLIGAFNHLHIFFDPDPDPEASFQERERLFNLPASNWTDYQEDLISEGGGVFKRDIRSIDVTPPMRDLLGIEGDQVSPNDLIQAMLRAQVDLLWFGGIGTFVKSSQERHFEADDKTNDYLRVDANELRCRVIGEGANLGVTQRGRIEYARQGGRINTDAIDNSGGVDVSDHEVNIKLTLGEVVAEGDLTIKQRDKLLGKMTDEVAELVLRDNYLQTQSISMTEELALLRLSRHRQLITFLEKHSGLDRDLEHLPNEKEMTRRESEGQGLTRPEIAVLLAYSKIYLYQQLLHSDLPDDPQLSEDLELYFPKPLRKKYRTAIQRHRLRREIIATYATNSMVNRVGPSFVAHMVLSTGMASNEIARAYIITREVFDLRKVWESIEALDHQIPAQVQLRLLIDIGELVERCTRWLLHHRPHPLDIEQNIGLFDKGVGKLARSLQDVLPRRDLRDFAKRQRKYQDKGLEEDLARRLAAVDNMESAFDVVQLSRRHGVDVVEAAQIYFLLGNRFRLPWLREKTAAIQGATHWEKTATAALVDKLYEHQSDLADCVLRREDRDLEAWLESRHGMLNRADDILTDMRSTGSVDLNMLTVASHQLRLLSSG